MNKSRLIYGALVTLLAGGFVLLGFDFEAYEIKNFKAMICCCLHIKFSPTRGTMTLQVITNIMVWILDWATMA